jgi:hypothetical protein
LKARDLPLAEPAPRAVDPSCAACRSFRPECLVPDGEGALAMCWLCAHQVVEHGRALADAMIGECDCLPTEIYPRSFFGATAGEFEAARDAVLERRRAR